MNEPLHNIDKLFKDAIEPMEDNPSKDVWENIEAGLDKKSAEKYKRKFILFKRLSIALLFLLLSISLFEINNRKTRLLEASHHATAISESKDDNKNTIPMQSASHLNENSNKKNIAHEKNSAPPGSTPGLFYKNNKNVSRDAYRNNENGLTVNGNRKSIAGTNKNQIKPTATISPLPITIGDIAQQAGQVKRTVANEKDKISETIVQNNYPSKEADKTVIDITGNSHAVLGKPSVISNKDALTSAIATAGKNNTKTKNKFKPQLSITGFLSPEITGYKLKNDPTVTVPNQNQTGNQIQEGENHELSFSMGALLNYRFAKKWALQSGLSFSNTVININPSTVYASADGNGKIKYRYNTSSGYAYVLPGFSNTPNAGDSLFTTSAKHTLQYVSIPLGISYQVQKRKLLIAPTIGFAANFLTAATIETSFENTTQQESETLTNIEGLRKMYFSIFFSTNFQYQLRNKLSVSLNPTFRFAVNPINHNNIVQSFPYSLGVAAGVTYRF